jgi:hypothetical protein
MKAAFYKATRPGMAGIYSRLVRWWTKSKYSHVELIFGDDIAASTSFIDGGVRFKAIAFDPEHWDFVDVPPALEQGAREWFASHVGQPYDILGNVHFVLSPVPDKKRAWFCSESVAAALGLAEPWRYDPGVLASTLSGYQQPAIPAAA